MNRLISFALTFTFLIIGAAKADYYVIGDITGGISKYFGFALTTTKVDAVKGEDGKFYSLAMSYVNVDEYKEKDKRCWINLKSKSEIGRLISLFKSNDFYVKNTKGELSKIDNLEYITFPCVKK